MTHPPSPSPFLSEGETVGSLRSKSRRRQHGGTLLGLAFGLVVGVLISFGVVWYLNKTPLPFVDKVTTQEPKQNGAKPAGGPVALPGKPGDKPIDKAGERKFEFYDILEGKKDATPQSAPPPAAPPPQSAAPADTLGSGKLFLQAGAFQKAADAENLKARLAMLGLEVAILEAEVPDKGTMHRVRVGPYASAEEMNRARGQLSQNGIPATVVRVKD
jgi:cell division protein FtsN